MKMQLVKFLFILVLCIYAEGFEDGGIISEYVLKSIEALQKVVNEQREEIQMIKEYRIQDAKQIDSLTANIKELKDNCFLEKTTANGSKKSPRALNYNREGKSWNFFL